MLPCQSELIWGSSSFWNNLKLLLLVWVPIFLNYEAFIILKIWFSNFLNRLGLVHITQVLSTFLRLKYNRNEKLFITCKTDCSANSIQPRLFRIFSWDFPLSVWFPWILVNRQSMFRKMIINSTIAGAWMTFAITCNSMCDC